MMRISVVGAVLFSAAGLVAGQLTAQNAPMGGGDLVGLWGAETQFGPQIRGAISVERGTSHWTLRVGGFELTAPLSGDTVHAVMPGGQGEFRGHLEPPGRLIGFWIQPAGNLSSYASPIRFERSGANAWSGIVSPVDDSFSLYLAIRRESDGSLRGVFRNPEANWPGRPPSFRLVREGGNLVFVEPASGKRRFVQAYDSARRQITFEFGSPLVLTPRTTAQASGFQPRTPSAAPYEYRVPPALGDGWATSPAAAVGVDASRLRALVQHIVAEDPTGDSAALIHSVLVARHGKLVLDEYFFGYAADRVHDLRSASKTFTSVLVGAASFHGARIDPSTPAYALFPGGPDLALQDSRRARVTLGHLLTHTSGLACDDNDDNSPGNEGTMQGQSGQPDWYQYFLRLPVVHDAGTTYAYCSGGMNLAAGVVHQVTGEWLPELFDRYVARPLQIERYGINLTPTGEAYGGGGVRMTPRDLLKFGQLYLHGGVWNGRRVVSAAWVTRSTSRQVDVPGESDGYGWHRNLIRAGGREYQEYEANGNGGQLLMVIPALDLAVVFTAGNYNQYRIWRKFRDELLPQYIIAAVQTP